MELICLGPLHDEPNDFFNKKMKFDCSLCDTLEDLTIIGLKSHLGVMNGYKIPSKLEMNI